MGFFDQVAKQVRDLHGRLTFSQKMSFVLLIAVVVFALVLFAGWGSRGEYLLVSREPLGAARAEVLTALDSAGIRYREVAGGLEVPASRYNEAIAVLAEHNIIPSEQIKIRLEDIAKDDRMFRTSEDKRAQRLIALQNWLGEVVSHMENISRASVGLDAPDSIGWLAQEDRGSASVQVWLQSGVDQLSKRQVDGIAALVSGVRRTIRKSDVNIVDQSGRAYRVASDDGDGAVGDRHEQQITYERRLAQDVSDMLSYYTPRKVMVRLKINYDRETVEEKNVDPEKVVDTMSTSEKTKSSSTPGDAGLAATVPGRGAALGTTGPSKTDSTESKTVQREIYTKITKMVKAPGEVEDVAVTVFVPREQVIEQIKGRGVEETAAAADVPKELDAVKKAIGTMLMVTDDKKITVQAVTFPKPKEPVTPEPAGAMAGYWTNYGRTTVLGVLSLAALFFLWRMVKKPVEMTAGPRQAYAAEQILTGLDTAAVAPDASEVVERKVRDMVRQNPTDAANMITRWVQSEG